MDWQTPIAAGVALLCGLWALWKFVRPFLIKESGGCHPSAQDELLQIESVGDPE